MTPEELMKPRYKVIADYPRNEHYENVEVGEIIEAWHPNKILQDNKTNFYGKYPHLFKPLEWWEERKVEDMPEYVKMLAYIKPCTDNPEQLELKKGQIFKPDRWVLNSFEISHFVFAASLAQPATKEEYEQFISKQS